MIFTREDILKILNALVLLGRRDSEFKDANTPLNNDDYIAIIQDGINKKVSINNLLSTLGLLKKDDFINVSDRYDEYYIQLSEAITIIANNKRKKGLVITFQDLKGDWKIYQFTGEVSNFINTELWKDLFDFKYPIVNSVLPDEEDLTLTYPNREGNSFIQLKDKEYDPENFSGMATKILRKRIVEVNDPELGKVKKNVLYQDDFNQKNCIYEIRYDFDLNGLQIKFPSNCEIRFSGGTINNGIISISDYSIIRGNRTLLKGLQIIIDGKHTIVENLILEGGDLKEFGILVTSIDSFCNWGSKIRNIYFKNYYKHCIHFKSNSVTENEVEKHWLTDVTVEDCICEVLGNLNSFFYIESGSLIRIINCSQQYSTGGYFAIIEDGSYVTFDNIKPWDYFYGLTPMFKINRDSFKFITFRNFPSSFLEGYAYKNIIEWVEVSLDNDNDICNKYRDIVYFELTCSGTDSRLLSMVLLLLETQYTCGDLYKIPVGKYIVDFSLKNFGFISPLTDYYGAVLEVSLLEFGNKLYEIKCKYNGACIQRTIITNSTKLSLLPSWKVSGIPVLSDLPEVGDRERANTSLLVSNNKSLAYFNTIEWIDVYGNPFGISYSGTSIQKPTPKIVGTKYFDTTINKPVYWNGSLWIDPTENISWATIE